MEACPFLKGGVAGAGGETDGKLWDGNGKREERAKCSWYAKLKKLIINKSTMKYHIALTWLKLKTINSSLVRIQTPESPAADSVHPGEEFG